MSNQFKNLVSVRRDKKDFYFLDKFVPPPPPPPPPSVSVTPTVTPTITPSITVTPTLTPTPTITPTVTPSLAACDLSYQVIDEASVFSYTIDTTLSSAPYQLYHSSPTLQMSDGLYNIDFGDGTVYTDRNDGSTTTHTYSSSGTYTIRIYPNPGESFERLIFVESGSVPTENSKQVTEVLSWGQWNPTSPTALNSGLRFCNNLTTVPNNIPTVSDITYLFWGCTSLTGDVSNWDVSVFSGDSIEGLFYSATSFNQDISSWDVSNITNLKNLFNRSNFNQNINSWDVSNVTTVQNLFTATPFNQPLSGWNTSNIQIMVDMFLSTPFNQDISSWDTSSVTNMFRMFDGASSFNQDISSWITSGVTTMEQMFDGATSFNQDISSWDTSSIVNFQQMFRNASSFNQDLGSWNISQLGSSIFPPTASQMFDGSGLSTTNYDNLLIGWASQAPSIQSGVTLGASGINRTSASATAYNTLTTTYGWTINDAGQI